MKNVSAFLKRHSALLLLVLVLATVPAGIAFGKYVKSLNVTSGISVKVSVAAPASEYTIHKGKLKDVLQDLDTPATALYFVKGSEVPKDAVQVVDKDTTRAKDIRADSKSGSIYAYQEGTDIYIAPADRVDAPLHAPADSSYFLSVNYNGGYLSVKESKIRLLTYIKCDNLDTSGVTDMSHMFCMVNDYGSETALATLDVSKFNTANVEDMSYMFCGCSSLTSLDLNFNTANVTDMSYMFQGCSALTSLDLKNFNTSKVTTMNSMFDECKSLTSLNLSKLNTGNVTDMSCMFRGCSALPELDLSNFNTSNVTTMSFMFKGCTLLPELDLSNFNTSNVTTMESMFYGCESLSSLDFSKFDMFDTSNVENMGSMFQKCKGLTSLDLSKFDTKNVIYMSFMFKNCTALPTLDVRNFDTSKATKMQYMFAGCSSLTALDLSRFNTSEVNNMQGMFCDCSNLATINASDEFKTDKVTSFMSSTDMFTNCTNLKGGNGTTYNSSKTDKTYAWIDGKDTKHGYFTGGATSTLSVTGSINGSGLDFGS